MQTHTTESPVTRFDPPRVELLGALTRFARQRPGFEFGNYGDVSAYRADSRRATRQLHDATALLNAVSWRSISAEAIVEASKHAYSGRLTITRRDDGQWQLDYCAGQYAPIEFRAALCAVLASALWDYWRECGHDTGDEIRKVARRELGASIARRWMS